MKSYKNSPIFYTPNNSSSPIFYTPDSFSNKLRKSSNKSRKSSSKLRKSKSLRKCKTCKKSVKNIHRKISKYIYDKNIEGIDNNYYYCYEDNIKKILNAIKKYSGKHNININKAELFINSQVSNIRRQAAKDIIDNTIYITLQEVGDIIEELILKLYNKYELNKYKNIYIYCGMENTSFYFMSIMGLYYIRKHKLKEPTNFIKTYTHEVFDYIGKDPIIMIDDASYSGSQLSNLLKNI
jgi:hypothetical protein